MAAAAPIRLVIRLVTPEVSMEKKVASTGETKVGGLCDTLTAKFHIKEEGFGLFFPPSQYRTSKWLMMNKTLEFYDLRDDEVLEFRKRHRPLRVKLPDGVYKTVVIDENMVVAELCKVIGGKVGITNVAEYSLKIEGSSALEWLTRNKTLIDQDIDSTVVLEFKQRLFFTDTEVNLNNPRELHLLYEQCRESILTGNCVCSLEEAIELAAYQLHLAHGDYDAANVPSFNAPDYLPPEYAKMKKAKRLIIDAYAECRGTNMEQAKYQYVSVCRGLKTYGVTFFTASEKISSKKEKPILLGVTKERIIKFDGKSKAVLAEWPLTYIRRCASTRSTFTVDFGVHEDTYHTYQTAEGESIQAVIEGYQHLAKSREEREAEEAALRAARGPTAEEIAAEEAAAAKKKEQKRRTLLGAPSKSNAGAAGGGANAAGPSNNGGGAAAASGGGGGAGKPDRGAAGEILVDASVVSTTLNQTGLADLNVELSYVTKLINNALEDIAAPAAAAPVADESWRRQAMETIKTNITAQTVRLCVSVAKVIAAVVVLKVDDFEPALLLSAVRLLGESVTELVTASRAVGALADGMMGVMVVDMCRMAITASLRVVTAATRASVALADGNIDSGMREELLSAAQTTGNAAWELLRRANANQVQDGHFKCMEKALAGAARAVTIVVACAKMSSEALQPGALKDNLVDSAMDVYTCVTHMTATARVTLPTILDPVAIGELEACTQDVLDAVGEVVATIHGSGLTGDHVSNVGQAQAAAQAAIDALLSVCKDPGDKASFEDLLRNAHEHIASAVSRLLRNATNPQSMLQDVKILGGVATDLVNSLRSAADLSPDIDLRNRLLAAANDVSTLAQALVMAAKASLANPGDAGATSNVTKLGMGLDAKVQQLLLDFSVALADPSVGEEFDDFSALISASKNLGTKVRKFSEVARTSASDNSDMAAAAAAAAASPYP